MPLVRRTRATFLRAELGFLGVDVNTRTQTPRFWGQAPSAGLLVRPRILSRPHFTSWLTVGIERSTPRSCSLKHTEPAATCPRRPGGAPGTLRSETWLAVKPSDPSKGAPGCQELALQKLRTPPGIAPGPTRRLRDPLVLTCRDDLLDRTGLQPLLQTRRLDPLGDDLLHGRRPVGGDLQPAVDLHAGPGRNQAAHDHVLLQPAQVIDPARDRRLGQDAGRLLEGGRRDERVGRQGGLGDPEQERPAGRRLTGLAEDPIVLGLEAELVDLLVHDEFGVAHLFDLHPAHHLAHDRLDVLVVDIDPLQAVDLLDLVDQVLLEVLLPLDAQDVVRITRPVDERVAGAHALPFLDVDVHSLGDLVLAALAGLVVRDDDLALALHDLPVADDAVNLGDHGGLLRAARLEQLDDARQPSGDVLGPGGRARDLRDEPAREARVLVLAHQIGLGREQGAL